MSSLALIYVCPEIEVSHEDRFVELFAAFNVYACGVYVLLYVCLLLFICHSVHSLLHGSKS